MNEELKIIIKAVTKSAQDEINKVRGELEQLKKSSDKASKGIGGSFSNMAAMAKKFIAAFAIKEIVQGLLNLGKAAKQFATEQGKLAAAFESSGGTAQQAAEAYNGLFRFLGDSGKASEAAAHLAKLTTNQQDLAEWTKISQGIFATFGDSLPIEGLTEAANETVRVGQVTGTLADALNWAGVSEDEFNAKLAQTSSLEEREALLRNTLNGLYSEAADIYERNNKAVLDNNESQARLNSAMGAAGMAVIPLLTALNNLGTAFFSALKPALDAIIPPIATFINWIAKAIQSVLSFFSALTGKSSTIKAVGEIGGAAAGAAKNLGSAAQGAKNLGSGMGGAEKAAEGAAKAVEDAKKSTQGFDELNIVSSGNSSSGGSGGSGGGGGSSSPGYASGGGSGLIDTATFGTEVQESEGMANSLADSIKETFGKLAEVFEPSISAWSDAFETVKKAWNNAKPDFINGAKDIWNGFKTLGNYLGTDFVPTVVNSFSTNLAPVVGDTLGFVVEEAGKQFAWLGGYVPTIVNDVIIPYMETWKTVSTDTFEIIGSAWEEHGGGLLESFSGFFEKIRGHIDNFYNNVFKPIWDKVVEVFNFVWEEGLKPLVDEFVDACLTIGEELLTLYNKVIAPIVDWIIEKIFPIIVNVVNGIIETVGNIVVAISGFIEGIIQAIKGIIQFIVGVFTGDWEKAWEGIKNFFEGIWKAIEGIIDTVLEVLGGIADFIVDVVAAAFEIAWEAIKLVWEQVVAFFQAVWDGICDVFAAVGEWFSGIFSDAWEGIKEAWNGVTGWFGEIWEGVKQKFSDVGTWFKTKFEDAWKKIKEVFKGWGSFFSGLWETIKSTFKDLGGKIAQGIGDAVKTAINGVISSIENTVNKGINLINKAIRAINKISPINISEIKTLSLPRLAKGGIVDDATIAMIGEAGKEAVVPLENNTEWMDKLADRLAARSKTPTKVILKVGEKELGWATIDAINGITEQTGGLQLAL